MATPLQRKKWKAAYKLRHPEKWKEARRQERLRERNLGPIQIPDSPEKSALRSKKRREQCTLSYVAGRLGGGIQDFPLELLEMKREQLLILRALKALKKQILTKETHVT